MRAFELSSHSTRLLLPGAFAVTTTWVGLIVAVSSTSGITYHDPAEAGLRIEDDRPADLYVHRLCFCRRCRYGRLAILVQALCRHAGGRLRVCNLSLLAPAPLRPPSPQLHEQRATAELTTG